MCTNRCGGRLFRALFAEVEIDSGGGYQDHRIAQPGYICLNCGSPAVDLSEVPAAMDAEAAEDEPAAGARPHHHRGWSLARPPSFLRQQGARAFDQPGRSRQRRPAEIPIAPIT